MTLVIAMSASRVFRWLWVSTLGLGLQMAILALLCRVVGLPVAVATSIAVCCAVLHNFLWHERWTWADRTTPTAVSRLRRFKRFCGLGVLSGLAGTVSLTAVGFHLLGLPLPLANLVAVVSLGVFNLFGAERWIFVDDRQTLRESS